MAAASTAIEEEASGEVLAVETVAVEEDGTEVVVVSALAVETTTMKAAQVAQLVMIVARVMDLAIKVKVLMGFSELAGIMMKAEADPTMDMATTMVTIVAIPMEDRKSVV